jgi:hypothetical protein
MNQQLRASAAPIACLLLGTAFLLLTDSEPRLVSTAEAADITCGSFFDKWEEPGIPANLLAMLGLGHELAAAQDCLAKNDVATACKHWSTVLVVTDKVELPLEENRAGLEKMMQEHECETAPAGTPSEEAAQ